MSSAFLIRAGLSRADSEQDTVEFEEAGGDVDLELAVPFLAGMDDVVLDSALLILNGLDAEASLDGWHTVADPGGNGVFVVLEHPARLRRVVISEASPPVAGRFLVLRAATLGPSGAPVEGAPLASEHAFASGPMLPAPLASLGLSGVGSGRVSLSPPVTSGQTWLVQYATGDSLATLAPVPIVPQVFSVTVLPAPEDVSLVLRAGDGAPEQPLWQHPGAVLAGAGDQVADFTPAAGARLSKAFAALNSAGGGAATMGLPLRFHSARGGTLGIRERRLDVRYLAHPLGPAPVKLTLDGGWQDVVLDAPVRAPSSNELRLAAKHLGLVVNPGSGVPPVSTPAGGVRVRAGHLVAGRTSWQPPSPSGVLARIRLFAAPVGDVEVVCELRRDAGGAPGDLLAPPAVARVAGSAAPGWVSFALPTAISPAPGQLWVTARTNRGELDWFSAELAQASTTSTAEGDTRISLDSGSSWAGLERGLGPSGDPLIQLLDLLDPASRPSPIVQVRIGPALVGGLSLAPGGAPGEYTESTSALPAGVLDVLRAPGTDARRRTTLSLWSPDLLDLTVTDLTCSYDAVD